MADECAVCFNDGRDTWPTPCCGTLTSTARLCGPCMDSMVGLGSCPLCSKRIGTRHVARQWKAGPAWKQRNTQYKPAELSPERPSARRARNAKKAGRAAAVKKHTQQTHRPTEAHGERLHTSVHTATGYAGVYREHNTRKYRAQRGRTQLGSYSTATSAAAAYARLLRRERYDVVEWAGTGPRDINTIRPTRVYVLSELSTVHASTATHKTAECPRAAPHHRFPHTHGGGRCYPPPRRGRPAPHPARVVALEGHPLQKDPRDGAGATPRHGGGGRRPIHPAPGRPTRGRSPRTATLGASLLADLELKPPS